MSEESNDAAWERLHRHYQLGISRIARCGARESKSEAELDAELIHIVFTCVSKELRLRFPAKEELTP